MTNDWICHEIKKIDLTKLDWNSLSGGLALPVFKCPYCKEEFKQETLDPIERFVCDACGYPFYEE